MNGEILMAKYKYFSTYETKMTDTQKNNFVKEHNMVNPYSKTTVEKFFSVPGILEMINMQCLHCHELINISFFLIKPAIDSGELAFPVEFCPHCEARQLIPKEVYDKLNK